VAGVRCGGGEGEGEGLGVGERVGDDVAVGLDVGVWEGVARGCGVGVRLRDGAGVGGEAEGTRATGEAGPGPQLARVKVTEISVRSSNHTGRRMGDFPFEHDFEKATKDATCHIVVFPVSRGDDLLHVPSLLGQPG